MGSGLVPSRRRHPRLTLAFIAAVAAALGTRLDSVLTTTVATIASWSSPPAWATAASSRGRSGSVATEGVVGGYPIAVEHGAAE